MADWKQIQARIRRARTGADPAGQLKMLFEKTRDAMAAFELAKHLEGAGQPAEAARWYQTAAERFRRADWKKKAEEAASRLGGGVSMEQHFESMSFAPSLSGEALPEPSPQSPSQESFEPAQTEVEPEPAATPVAAGAPESPAPEEKKRRRRGRRGGRNRRRGKNSVPGVSVTLPRPVEPKVLAAPVETHPAPPPPRTPTSESTGPGIRGRSGDPALSSRLAHLEMQLRRLLASPPSQMDEASHAPAGPGVFLVSDSDQITYYYSESCKTLRIGIGSLLRAGGPRSGEESLKSRFADHLGIPETRVAKYLNDHCVVRWLQLDEGASNFAHFVVAILRPVLND
jgi:hypothetical protein